eukprot:3698185-Prymnesium_polylepis.1
MFVYSGHVSGLSAKLEAGQFKCLPKFRAETQRAQTKRGQAMIPTEDNKSAKITQSDRIASDTNRTARTQTASHDPGTPQELHGRRPVAPHTR